MGERKAIVNGKTLCEVFMNEPKAEMNLVAQIEQAIECKTEFVVDVVRCGKGQRQTWRPSKN